MVEVWPLPNNGCSQICPSWCAVDLIHINELVLFFSSFQSYQITLSILSTSSDPCTVNLIFNPKNAQDFIISLRKSRYKSAIIFPFIFYKTSLSLAFSICTHPRFCSLYCCVKLNQPYSVLSLKLPRTNQSTTGGGTKTVVTRRNIRNLLSNIHIPYMMFLFDIWYLIFIIGHWTLDKKNQKRGTEE